MSISIHEFEGLPHDPILPLLAEMQRIRDKAHELGESINLTANRLMEEERAETQARTDEEILRLRA
jgi:hypothetical protein